MPESEKSERPDSPKASRSFSSRAERSLKEADRLLQQDPDGASQQQAMAQVERAKVMALLELADAIREKRKS